VLRVEAGRVFADDFFVEAFAPVLEFFDFAVSVVDFAVSVVELELATAETNANVSINANIAPSPPRRIPFCNDTTEPL
jgi:hypothetical protein